MIAYLGLALAFAYLTTLVMCGVCGIAEALLAWWARVPFRVRSYVNLKSHWGRGNGVRHGPQTWPWWRLAGFLVCPLHMSAPSFGWRLWVYTRWGVVYGDVYFDRRPRPLTPLQREYAG